MAIKGKGRTRTRQPIRAPRRGPVPVPVPFARRKGVQLMAAFVAGLLVFWGGIWLTNGLRAERVTEEERAASLRRRQAGASWNELAHDQIATIGTFPEGRPPELFPEVADTIRELKRRDPEDAVSTLQDAADRADTVIEAIDGFDMIAAIRDKGFDEAAVLRFLAARDELVSGIELTKQSALVGVIAADLDGEARTRALERANDLLSLAGVALTRFFQEHTEAMSASGIVSQPTLPGS